MNITIIIIITIGLMIHRYLKSLRAMGTLPYVFGFDIFSFLFITLYLINFIWQLGLSVGGIFFGLTVFNFIHMSFLWPTQLPWVLRLQKDARAANVSLPFYGLWASIVIILIPLTIANFFVSDYMSLHEITTTFIRENGVGLLIFIIFSNFLRSFLKKKLTTN